MRIQLLSSLPAIVALLVASHGGSAMAQTYTFSNLYPADTTTLQKTTVTCTGQITISQGATAPTNVKVVIQDNFGDQYTGTGSAMNAGQLTYNFVSVLRTPS
jgi:hypothetical protein